LANGFSARGYQVDVVLAKAEGPYLDDVGESVRIVDLNASRVIASLPGLIRYLRRERPEALLSAMGHANVAAVMAKALAQASTRVVVSEHSTFTQASSHAASWRSIIVGRLRRWAYSRADGIVAVSSGVAADLSKSAGIAHERISVIYNPVVSDELIDQSVADPGHPWLAEQRVPVVLGVGRLTKAKDFPTLIRAFAQARRQRQVRLVILGEGELREDLKELVARLSLTEDVDLPGFVKNPFPFMRQSDLFVLSSAWEGLPSVLIQAMACGAPVVSTDCRSGPSEILEGGRWGRLVPVGDADALAQAIKAALDDPRPADVAVRAADFNLTNALQGYEHALFPDTFMAHPARGSPAR
jgi:glycosyltransferase involved in cell wall biosynthesis